MANEPAYFGANKLPYPAADKLANPGSLVYANIDAVCVAISATDLQSHSRTYSIRQDK